MSTTTRGGTAILFIILLILAFLVLGKAITGAHAVAPGSSGIVGPSNYHISVFAKGTNAYFNPDPITVDGNYVLVAYQNATNPDGTGGSSTVVEYNKNGEVQQIFSILGHCDGLRVDPGTHFVWALVNNDANPHLFVIHPNTKQITAYTFPTPPHGGGYDDLAFLAGSTYISASNPINLTNGVNTKPAVVKISLPSSGSTVKVTPILHGNAKAIDTTTGTTVTLNLLDPDSLTIDPKGDIVLVDQGDSEVVFIHNPGTPAQKVTVVPTGTQLDDTVWATTTSGHMYAVDITLNTIYTIRTNFVVNTVYTEAPSDSGVASFIGTLNLTTGTVTPVLTGFSSPTGLIFVP